MIFLSKIDNMTLCRAICFPDDMPRLNRNTAVILPTPNEELYLELVHRFRYNGSRLRFKGLNFMLYPKHATFKAGIKTIRYMDKEYNMNVKRLKTESGCVVTQSTGSIKDYNVTVNQSKILGKVLDPSVNYSKSNIINIWKACLDFHGLEHVHKYLVITPQISKINVRNSAAIKMNAWRIKDMWISLLWHLIYDHERFIGMLKSQNCGIIITDHRYTVKINFNDPNWDERFHNHNAFLKELFFLMKRMHMGIIVEDEDADLEAIVDENKDLTVIENPIDVSEDVINDTTITKTMEIVDKLNEDKETTEEVKEEADELATIMNNTIESVEQEEKEEEKKAPLKSTTVKKETKKERQLKETVAKITAIVEKDQQKNISIPLRLETVEKKQQKIMDENLVEVLARLEDIAESMIEPDVVKRNSTFGTFRINKLDSQYEEIAKKDRLDIAESFNKNSVPLYLTNYKDVQNKISKDSYTRKVQMTFESPHSKERHVFSMNIPELRDGKFLHMNGSDKVMIRQKMALPIIKLDDGVVCTSYYGKMFVGLTSGNLSKTVARIKSFIRIIRKKLPNSYLKKWFSFTPAYYTAKDENNLGPELLEISRYMTYVKINEDNWIDLSSGTNIIACINGEKYRSSAVHDTVTNLVGGEVISCLTLFNEVLSKLEVEDKPIYDLWAAKATGTTSKNIAYSKLDRWPGGSIPLLWIVLHSYGENLLPILEVLRRDYNLIYEITPKQGTKLIKNKFLEDDGDRFLFKDFALDVKYGSVSNRHLLQPLHTVDTTEFDSLMLTGITEMVTNSSNVVMAMETYEDLFWDPITIKVMDDVGVPSGFGESLIYANNLIQHYDRTVSEISLKNERMPSNSEVIQGATYACIAKEYRDYSIKVKRGSRNASFSVQQDAVLSYLATLPNVEESSKINAIQHIDKLYSVSNKGISGVNNSRSYTVNKRKWDETFYGIMSDVSPYGPATGIVKHLAVNPNIKDVRGYFVSKNPEEVKSDEIMSVSEALRPFTQKHDSSPRTAMSMMQANHLMGTEGSEPALVTYGMDETMAFLDSDFAKRMKDNGEVVFRNDRFMRVKYDNLKDDEGNPIEEVIDLEVIERNSAKAFYTPNKMNVNSQYRNAKVGSRIKKDTILAYNSNYYQEMGDDVVFKSGPIVNIAIYDTQYAYEDATVMSESLAQKLQTKVLKRIAVRISPRHQIKEVRTVLGPIAGGDVLIKVSEDSGSTFLNKNYDLSSLEDRLMKVEKSNYNGVLRDIYIYYKLSQKDEEEMDPSIKKFMNTVDNYYKKTFNSTELAKGLPEYEKNRMVDHVTKFTDNRKNTVNGDLVNKGDILIEFFIEVNQNFSSGDKITIGNTALKGVDSKILPDNMCPKGVESGRKYDLVLSPYGPLARMIYSSFLVGYLTAAAQKINENIMKIINNNNINE